MSEWISVKDRLPELGNGQGKNQYLVCYITPKSKQRHVIQSGYWGGNRWSKNFAGEATHWMPLPEPPKGE